MDIIKKCITVILFEENKHKCLFINDVNVHLFKSIKNFIKLEHKKLFNKTMEKCLYFLEVHRICVNMALAPQNTKNHVKAFNPYDSTSFAIFTSIFLNY